MRKVAIYFLYRVAIGGYASEAVIIEGGYYPLHTFVRGIGLLCLALIGATVQDLTSTWGEQVLLRYF